MFFISREVKITIWFASFVVTSSLLLPAGASVEQQKATTVAQKNATSNSNPKPATTTSINIRTARAIDFHGSESVQAPVKLVLGDSVSLDTALEGRRDLMPAAGEHKKYILVKKKPKHKKIKMEIYKPKMKYKKIKMKVPVKKMKKKKVKGYLVKKEKHGYH